MDKHKEAKAIKALDNFVIRILIEDGYTQSEARRVCKALEHHRQADLLVDMVCEEAPKEKVLALIQD